MNNFIHSDSMRKYTTYGFAKADQLMLHIVQCEADIEPVVFGIVTSMKQYGFTQEHCLSMRMVIHELCINAVYHGNCCDTGKKVTILYTVSHQKIRAAVLDEGNGYNTGDIANPTLPEHREKSSGRGLHIAAHYCDEFNVIEPGNCSVVVKYAAKNNRE